MKLAIRVSKRMLDDIPAPRDTADVRFGFKLHYLGAMCYRVAQLKTRRIWCIAHSWVIKQTLTYDLTFGWLCMNRHINIVFSFNSINYPGNGKKLKLGALNGIDDLYPNHDMVSDA